MLFLAPGGMSTRRSGLRLFMPKFMGGGDLACMFLFMPPGETSRPGELRWFPYPFPERAKKGWGVRGRKTLDMILFLSGTWTKRHSYMSLNLFQKFNESWKSCCPWWCSLIKNYRNPFSSCAHFFSVYVSSSLPVVETLLDYQSEETCKWCFVSCIRWQRRNSNRLQTTVFALKITTVCLAVRQ